MDYLNNLINRICDRSDQLHDTQTISWQALREAEQLANHAYIPTLYTYIDQETDKEKRRAALYIIAQLSRNTNDPEVIRFLIDRLKFEQDADMITGIQQDLERGLPIPSYINVQPLLNNTLSANPNIRRSALLALKGTKNPQVEDWVLQILQRTVNEYDIYYITVLLSKIATRKSLPALKRLLDHSRQDVRSLAFTTIADIEREREVMFYARCLMRGQLKFEAMEAIYKYADENAIQAVINRITELLSRKRTQAPHLNLDSFKNGFTDLMLGMEFLWKFRTAKAEVKKTFSWIAEKKAEYLLPEEREWMQRNLAIS
ncbi:HEAT repeat domain-containing protein [Chitinophaga sp. CB10]|uniref:HEAT repeat domain-containing protein n=1 Tax=Chitinophaga sp. CB10 TaxID=1891659 RepID=UPI0025BFA290|nr:HEAT repeat domain-containing protein [Chitinophaga sp. CB10]